MKQKYFTLLLGIAVLVTTVAVPFSSAQTVVNTNVFAHDNASIYVNWRDITSSTSPYTFEVQRMRLTPLADTNLSVVQTSYYSAKLLWNNATVSTPYHSIIERSTSPTFDSNLIAFGLPGYLPWNGSQLVAKSGWSYADNNNLAPGTYYYRVRECSDITPIYMNSADAARLNSDAKFRPNPVCSAYSPTASVRIIPPPTASLSANPSSITEGRSSTLTWNTANAVSVTLDGSRVAANGSLRVTPSYTTTYNLIAGSIGGTNDAEDSATVVVTPPIITTTTPPGGTTTTPPALLPTASLSANPVTIDAGQTSTLTWETTNASVVRLDGVVVGATGSKEVSPTRSTTYSLVATGAGGVGSANASANASVTVRGTQTPAPTISISANPGVITRGQSSNISWTTTNAAVCNASGDWSGGKSTAGSEDVTPSNSGKTLFYYELICTGAGGTKLATVAVQVNEVPPTIKPTVVSTDPANFDENVSLGTALQVAFSKKMNEGSVSISLSETNRGSNRPDRGVGGTISFAGDTIAIFTPDGPLSPGASYRAVVSGADINGNQLSNGSYVWFFKTAPGATANPPVVISANPAPGEQNVPTDSDISVQFSSPMSPDTVRSAFSVPDPTTGRNICNVSASGDGASCSHSTLTPNTWYDGSISRDARDANGNNLVPFSWKFKTASKAIPAVNTCKDYFDLQKTLTQEEFDAWKAEHSFGCWTLNVSVGGGGSVTNSSGINCSANAAPVLCTATLPFGESADLTAAGADKPNQEFKGWRTNGALETSCLNAERDCQVVGSASNPTVSVFADFGSLGGPSGVVNYFSAVTQSVTSVVGTAVQSVTSAVGSFIDSVGSFLNEVFAPTQQAASASINMDPYFVTITNSLTQPVLLDKGLASDAVYLYRVRVKYANGTFGKWAEARAAKTLSSTGVAPTSVSAPICTRNSYCAFSIGGLANTAGEFSESQCRNNNDCRKVGKLKGSVQEK